MIDLTLVDRLHSASDSELHDILRESTAFTESVVLAVPELAVDASFDLYGPEWMNRYWRRLIVEVHGAADDTELLKWATNATIGALAELIAKHFGVPNVAVPACVAMAVLIIRAAKKAAPEQRTN